MAFPDKNDDLTDDMGGKGVKSLLDDDDDDDEDMKYCDALSLGILLLLMVIGPCLVGVAAELGKVACLI